MSFTVFSHTPFFLSFRYLYINVERTAMTLMSSSDLETFQSDTGIAITGNVGDNKMEFCLTGQVTTNVPNSNTDSNNLSHQQKVEKDLLNYFSTSNLLSGGHLSCKYCVEKCPAN